MSSGDVQENDMSALLYILLDYYHHYYYYRVVGLIVFAVCRR